MNRKVMRKSTLISSIAMLLVAVLALSGVTFAWFTTETTAETGKIMMQANASSGLYVAGTTTKPLATDWAGTLGWGQENNFKPTSAAFYKEGDVDHLSSPFFYFTTTDRADGVWAGADVTRVDSEAGGDKYFVARHVWIASDSTANNVQLTMTMDATANGQYMGYERMAIVDVTDPTNPVLLTGKVISFNGNDSAEAIISDKVTDGQLDTRTVDAAPFTGTFTFEAGEVSKENPKHLMVYFWFEGQDTDCKNEKTGANINCDIDFGLIIPAEG